MAAPLVLSGLFSEATTVYFPRKYVSQGKESFGMLRVDRYLPSGLKRSIFPFARSATSRRFNLGGTVIPWPVSNLPGPLPLPPNDRAFQASSTGLVLRIWA